MVSLISDSEDKTFRAGQTAAKYLKPGDVVALSGRLGAGKTVFAKGLAKGLGVTAEVSSPTFNIVREYEGGRPLYHFDFYRLNNMDELLDIGFEDYLYGKGVCVVEWADLFPEAIPHTALFVNIEYQDGGLRKITMKKRGVI